MRSLAVLGVICLAIIGTVSAATISPGTIQGIRMISTIDPHLISVNQPQTTLMGMLSVTSTPSAATVLIDGSSTLYGAPIPLTNFNSLAIVSGQHTITVKHTGYGDYSSTFSVSPGGTASVNAPLQPLKVMVNQLNPVVASGAVARNIEVQAVAANTPATSVPTPTPTLLPCPSGYLCESLAAAQSAYGADGYTKYGDLPCNYTMARVYSSEQVKEYCIKPVEKLLKRIALNPMIIKPVGGVQNPVGIVKPVPAVPVPAIHSPLIITRVAVVDSFLDMVSSGIWGIFGTPVSRQPAIPRDVCVCQPPFFCHDGTNAHGDPCNCHSCNGRCVDLSADKTNCGSCGYVCYSDHNCYNGQCFWDTGRCGTAADCYFTTGGIPDSVTEWQCVNSYCNRTCKAGYLSCKFMGDLDVCRDILNDGDNCGSCDHHCGGGHTCQNGVCVATFN